jgi:hypothetical protein
VVLGGVAGARHTPRVLAIGLVQLLLLLAALVDVGTALALALHLPAEPASAPLGRVAVGAFVALGVARLIVTVGLARRAAWSRAGALVVVLLGAADLPHGPLVALVTLAVLAGRAGGAWFAPPPAPRPEGYGLPFNAFAPPPPPPTPRALPGLVGLSLVSLGLGAAAAWTGPGLLPPAGRDDPLHARAAALLDLRGLCWPSGLLERLAGRAPTPPGGTAPLGSPLEPGEIPRAPDGTPLGPDGQPTLAKPARAVKDLPGHYRYTDDAGTAHITPDFDSIPERYRY